MKKVNQKGKFSITILLSLFCATLLLLAVSCPYQKMNPAPDVDKGPPAPAIDNSCWMATAANMLAGAGYGNGNTVQQRAEDIYADICFFSNCDKVLFSLFKTLSVKVVIL